MQPPEGAKQGGGVAGGLGLTFQAPVGHHLQALFLRAAALEAIVPSPLTAQVRRGAGNTLEVPASSGKGGNPA